MSKPFHDMTVEELQAEWKEWDEKIKNATAWGAALAVAYEFRTEIERELNRRSVDVG